MLTQDLCKGSLSYTIVLSFQMFASIYWSYRVVVWISDWDGAKLVNSFLLGPLLIKQVNSTTVEGGKLQRRNNNAKKPWPKSLPEDTGRLMRHLGSLLKDRRLQKRKHLCAGHLNLWLLPIPALPSQHGWGKLGLHLNFLCLTTSLKKYFKIQIRVMY